MVNAAYMRIGNHLTDDDDQNYPHVKINLILNSMLLLFYITWESNLKWFEEKIPLDI